MINEVNSSLYAVPIRLNGAEFYPPGMQLQPPASLRPLRQVESELLPDTTARTLEFMSQQYAGSQKAIIEPDYEFLHATASYQAIEYYAVVTPTMDIFV